VWNCESSGKSLLVKTDIGLDMTTILGSYKTYILLSFLLIQCVMSSCLSHLATTHGSVFFLIKNKIPASIYSSDNSGIRWIPAEGSDLCQMSGLWDVIEKTQIRVCYRVICDWWGGTHLNTVCCCCSWLLFDETVFHSFM